MSWTEGKVTGGKFKGEERDGERGKGDIDDLTIKVVRYITYKGGMSQKERTAQNSRWHVTQREESLVFQAIGSGTRLELRSDTDDSDCFLRWYGTQHRSFKVTCDREKEGRRIRIRRERDCVMT